MCAIPMKEQSNIGSSLYRLHPVLKQLQDYGAVKNWKMGCAGLI